MSWDIGARNFWAHSKTPAIVEECCKQGLSYEEMARKLTEEGLRVTKDPSFCLNPMQVKKYLYNHFPKLAKLRTEQQQRAQLKRVRSELQEKVGNGSLGRFKYRNEARVAAAVTAQTQAIKKLEEGTVGILYSVAINQGLCQYPTGTNPETGEMLCCGTKLADGQAASHGRRHPYCLEHDGKSYQPGTAPPRYFARWVVGLATRGRSQEQEREVS